MPSDREYRRSRVPRSVRDLRASTRKSSHVAFARQSAMYLANVVLGLNFSEIGRSFGRDRTTAAHACRLVELRRDDLSLDATLCELENAIKAFPDDAVAIGESKR